MRSFILWLFSHRTLALIRWDFHFLRIRFNNAIFFKRKVLNRLLNNGIQTKYLNLGSGPRGINDGSWINIDGFKDKNVHYLCDFNRQLPFASETFDGIFCEHVLEHFNYDDGKKLMIECKRILKSNGKIRLVVPDGNKILRSYFENPEFITKIKNSKNGFAMEAVNTWFYQRYEHQCIYDAAYLIDMLISAGFSKAVQCQFKNSAFKGLDLILDDPTYEWESLYVEAIK